MSSDEEGSPVTAPPVPPPAASGGYTRRHKAAVRRVGSFRRFETIPELVDEWFFTDAALHASWAAFAAAHRDKSPLFQQPQPKRSSTPPPAPGQRSVTPPATDTSESLLLAADHQAKATHDGFCEVFETALEAFLASKKFTMDEFQEAFKLAKEEEERDGTHFYRWTDVVEFDIFVEFMRGGTAEALMQAIRRQTSHAQLEYRKKVSLFPLLAEWAPPEFADVDAAVQAVTTGEKPSVRLQLSRPDMKELVRWKNKLLAKQLGPRGVYEAQPRDEVTWARYLGFAAKGMSAADFDRFVAGLKREANKFIEAHTVMKEHPSSNSNSPGLQPMSPKLGGTLTSLDATLDGASPSSPMAAGNTAEAQAERRALLACYNTLDVFHRGSVDLGRVLTVLDKSGLVNAKARKKLEMKYKALRNQQSLDQVNIGEADNSLESGSPRHSASDEVQLDMTTTLKLLREALYPSVTAMANNSCASGTSTEAMAIAALDAEAHLMFQRRLHTVQVTAQDCM